MKIKSCLLRLLSVMLAVCLLSGCGASSDASKPAALSSIVAAGGLPIPDWLADRIGYEPSDTDEQPVSANVCLYHDNTRSTYGYAAGDSTAGKEGFVYSHFTQSLQAVNYEWTKKFGAALYCYTLDSLSPASNIVSWTSIPEADLWSRFHDEDFYLLVTQGDDRNTPLSGKDRMGPLNMLFDGQYRTDSFDPTAINIILSDLEEQGQKGIQFATKLYDTVLTQPGYAICVIGMSCYFDGIRSVPNQNDPSSMHNLHISDSVPFYAVLTGPEKQLNQYVINLLNVLHSRGDDIGAGGDFQIAYFEPGRGFVDFARNEKSSSYQRNSSASDSIPASSIYIPETAESVRGKGIDWAHSEFNTLLSLTEQSATSTTGAANLFGLPSLTDAEQIHVFTYNDVNRSGRFVLNYYVPLPSDVDETNLLLDFSQPGKGETWQGAVLAYAAASGSVGTATERTNVDAQVRPTRRPSKEEEQKPASSSVIPEPVVPNVPADASVWFSETHTETDLTLNLTMTSRILTAEDGKLSDPSVEADTGAAADSGSRRDAPSEGSSPFLSKIVLDAEGSRQGSAEQEPLTHSMPDGKVLQVTITGSHTAYPGSVLLLDVPVYIHSDWIPDWILSYSGVNEKQTYLLDSICHALFGFTQGSSTPQRSTLLTHLVTVIAELPAQ